MRLCITFRFVLLCLSVLEEKHTNEEIQKEEGSNQNENKEEIRIEWRVLLSGTLIDICGVHSCKHDIGPAFQTSHNKESHHSLEDVVKVWVVSNPRTTSHIALVFVVVLVNIVRAIEEFARENVNRENGKHEPDSNHDDNHIEDSTNGFH